MEVYFATKKLAEAHDPPPTNEYGGLDWNAVTAIMILEVTDYHGD